MEICGYKLDKQQEAIVLDDSKYLLVTAGAGSGKTLAILGKIKYLINEKKIKPNEIICISFTRASSKSLENKIKKEINKKIDVYTFHKLGLEMLKNTYTIADSRTLENITREFFSKDILTSKYHLKAISKYFKTNNYEKFYQQNYIKIIELENICNTFIHLFKSNDYKITDFVKFLNKLKINIFTYKKNKILLILILNIYLKYEKYLKDNNEIDFDDILIKSSELVNDNYNRKIKYIIIDEYQDTSKLRFKLIKCILEKTNAKLMVVGDDFQSIYRFTGCDLSLFLEFNKIFKDSKIMKIENTYRNSQELIDIAGSFVMKNKEQIKKNLKSNKHIDHPIIIIEYSDIKNAFKNLILKIYNETNKPILVIGRNNIDIVSVINKKYFIVKENNITYIYNEKIKIYYLTAHKSKGLEEENVIVINLVDTLLGFPNKIKEEKILRHVIPSKSRYPYDEERRLFYVALTRTKNRVYLLCPIKNKCLFVNSLLKNNKKSIKIIKM